MGKIEIGSREIDKSLRRLGFDVLKFIDLSSEYELPLTAMTTMFFWEHGQTHRLEMKQKGVPLFELDNFLKEHDLELVGSDLAKDDSDYLTLSADKSWSARIRIADDEISVSIMAESMDRCVELCAGIDLVMYVIAIEDHETVMRFWMMGAHGMELHTKNLDFPDLKSVMDGYPNDVSGALKQLIEVPMNDSGNIILFHGPPGTGKTTAIRALANYWKEDVCFNVIIEPDIVFATYSNIYQMRGGNRDQARKKQVYVIEDSDELIREDGKARTGQALAKLLNMTDGLIGQGVDFNVIITTNEPMDKLHPALIRPGRCLADIHFSPLTRAEAELRFPDRDFNGKEITLADAYANAPIRTEKKDVHAGTYL